MEYKKLKDVEFVETTSKNTNMIIEEDGVIKRCSKPLDLIHTAVIRQINYLEDEEFKKEFECINMTFEEAKSIVMSRGVLTILLQLSSGATLPTTYYVDYEFEVSYNEFIITAWKHENGSREVIYWREDGLVMF